MLLDPAHQLMVSMRIMCKSTDGVDGSVLNLPYSSVRPPREAGFREKQRLEASEVSMKYQNV